MAGYTTMAEYMYYIYFVTKFSYLSVINQNELQGTPVPQTKQKYTTNIAPDVSGTS